VRVTAVILLLIVPQLALSQTTVSGNQSGVWTATGSPYLVTGELAVPSGQTLTIEPGVEVNFQGHFKLTVNGRLDAVGADGDTICFTTDTPLTGWGGIRIDSGQISTLTYCRIEYGRTSGDYPDIHGGGLALLSSDAVVSNCVFADNDATGEDNGMGGAVYGINTGSLSEPLTRFTDCRFIRNHAYGEGGAIKFTGDMNTEITRCEFIENDCNYGGGAVSCYSVFGTRMTNCLFADNYTMYSSGGAVNTLGAGNTVYFINCTLSGNSAVTGDGGGVNLAYATGYFVNTIIIDNPGMYSDDLYLDWVGSAEIYYCDMAVPSGATGNNNINDDPEFVDAANLDFQLTETSPCIDEGTAFLVAGGDTLVNLAPAEYHGSAPDMGAYEFNPASGVHDEPATVCNLYQNYPNPFRLDTVISYRLPSDGHVTMDVYNIAGQEVRALVNATQTAGEWSITWDGRSNSGRSVGPGAYFLRLQTGDQVSVMRMLLSD